LPKGFFAADYLHFTRTKWHNSNLLSIYSVGFVVFFLRCAYFYRVPEQKMGYYHSLLDTGINTIL